MVGLVSYGSSDDEDNVDDTQKSVGSLAQPSVTAADGKTHGFSSDIRSNGSEHPVSENGTEYSAKPLPEDTSSAGPVLGPTIPTNESLPSTEALEDYTDPRETPQSPYTANRALLRDLTLPQIPNYDIPPSPPGSPVASTNAKFKQFLELKKKGVHFNEKLAKSSALKNPSLMQKLMDFSGIDEAGQYSTTLPKEIWDPDIFPEYAYREGLAKSQQKILKRKEDEKVGARREFVAASTSGESISRSGTPPVMGRSQKSASERVMAGLDRATSSPHTQGVKRKSRFDT